MTPAERQQLKRDRRKAGLVLVQEWVPAQSEALVREAIRDTLHRAAGSQDHLSEALPRPA